LILNFILARGILDCHTRGIFGCHYDPTCLVFAQHVATREQYPEDCPAFDPVNKKKLEEDLQQFFQV
jgi:CO dehydrogenase/acetyl-CoA synthase gamma subunit (corrinoid Fe-S protein)